MNASLKGSVNTIIAPKTPANSPASFDRCDPLSNFSIRLPPLNQAPKIVIAQTNINVVMLNIGSKTFTSLIPVPFRHFAPENSSQTPLVIFVYSMSNGLHPV